MNDFPFTLHDVDIDQNMPVLVSLCLEILYTALTIQKDPSVQYLLPLVKYVKLAATIVPNLPKFGSNFSLVDNSACLALEIELDQWALSTSREFSSALEHEHSGRSARTTNIQHYETLIAVCSNQLKISLYKHNLFSPDSIVQNPYFAHKAVASASDTIHVCSNLQKTSKIYESQAVHYNFFVLSAIGSLYLAVRHAPLRFKVAPWDIFTGLEILKTCCSAGRVSNRISDKVLTIEKAMTALGYSSIDISCDNHFQQTNASYETSCPTHKGVTDEMQGSNITDFAPKFGLFDDFPLHNLVTESYDVNLVGSSTNQEQL